MRNIIPSLISYYVKENFWIVRKKESVYFMTSPSTDALTECAGGCKHFYTSKLLHSVTR